MQTDSWPAPIGCWLSQGGHFYIRKAQQEQQSCLSFLATSGIAKDLAAVANWTSSPAKDQTCSFHMAPQRESDSFVTATPWTLTWAGSLPQRRRCPYPLTALVWTRPLWWSVWIELSWRLVWIGSFYSTDTGKHLQRSWGETVKGIEPTHLVAGFGFLILSTFVKINK